MNNDLLPGCSDSDMEMVEKILSGDVGAASMLMKDIEDEVSSSVDSLKELYQYTGKAYVVGVTGMPGVGKSTLIDNLIKAFCQDGYRVGVLAIDPSSPYTGGAILGDRIRMKYFSKDQSVFIRSIATRGWSGGLSKHTLSMIHVMDAMGKDLIIVETVGSGQVEIDITKIADTSVVIMCPGAGDEIQTMKGGILEAADVLVVNKADRDGADDLLLSLEIMLNRRVVSQDCWKPGVFATQSLNGQGIAELKVEILRHKHYLVESGGLLSTRRQRTWTELYEAIRSQVESYILETITSDPDLDKKIDAIICRKSNPYIVVDKIIHQLTEKHPLKMNRRIMHEPRQNNKRAIAGN